MKVAVVHNLGRGGARRRLENQVRLLPHEIVEVCLSTATPITEAPHLVPYREIAPTLPRASRVPVRYTDLARIVLAWREVSRIVRGLGADVMYVGPCGVLQSPPVLSAAGLPPSLYFCDEPRRVDYEENARTSRNSRTERLYAPLYAAQRSIDRRAVHAADHIATNSRFTARAIRAAYDREADPVVLGVAPELKDVVPAQPRHLLSVGTIIPTKGHRLVIEAAARTQWRRPVLVIGNRSEDGEDGVLQALAGRLGVELEIRLGVTDGELQQAYAEAFATLYLAEREPLGLVALEAQACGCPVLVADEGGLPETIVEGHGGWALPRDADAVAARLDELEGADRVALAAAARSAVAPWTWEHSAQHIDTLLQELGAGMRAGATS